MRQRQRVRGRSNQSERRVLNIHEWLVHWLFQLGLLKKLIVAGVRRINDVPNNGAAVRP